MRIFIAKQIWDDGYSGYTEYLLGTFKSKELAEKAVQKSKAKMARDQRINGRYKREILEAYSWNIEERDLIGE
jgi:hypothetical protein